ncbi:unnamed protein product [marine sediment metagenome]|uniref:Serine aminopeptidase S33 domain-containing protein n=1 Tax=marine sediment metagenome TaxID=412755 RepID=X1DWZ4_9ZZZZ
MKLNKKRIIAFSVIIVVFLLLLPIIYKDRTYTPLVGPSLSEIEYTEIYFNNGNLKLAGMMILPEGEGPFPVAVIIHGSGTSTRDSKWYLTVANHLQENGIAVLLPDKRGSEKSEGKWIGASFEELAGDTISAIEYIRTQDQFNYSKIGVIGMSQGGWIAPVVAAKTEDLAFVVSMSGPIVTQEEQLLYEEIHNIAPYTYTFIAKLIAPLTTKNLMKKEYIKGYAGFDPIPYWEQVNIPAFIALGENDKMF